MSKQLLTNKIALVTGASRGVGRGIAQVLGENGVTVYVSGRSTRRKGNPENLPGSIEETAQLVTEAGGTGIAMHCDHKRDEEVEELFQQIMKNHQRLDLLVNNVWGGYENYDETFSAPFWEQPLFRWEGMYTAGLRAHFIASRLAAPLMIAQKSGLIINISAGDRGKFLHNTMYDTAKCAVDRLAFGMAKELRKHQVAAISLYPGFVRTERVLQAVKGDQNFDINQTHSPQYVGRAVVALAADSQIIEKSGQTFAVGDLAKEYGFTDIDGRLIEAFRIPDYPVE